MYVSRIKGNVAAGMTKEDAVNEAVNFAIRNDFLDGYFKIQKKQDELKIAFAIFLTLFN